jgi:protein TonB
MGGSLPTPPDGLSRLKLPFALALSALLHAALLFWPRASDAPATPAVERLQARLLAPRPAEAQPEPPAATPLLKDTRSERGDEAPPAPAVVPAPTAAPVASARARERAQRQLNKHVFYPQEAIDRGLEGEVKLRLLLDGSGRVMDAAVLAGSGHPLLDRAALDAARQIGRIDAGGARELLLPVVFRLE